MKNPIELINNKLSGTAGEYSSYYANDPFRKKEEWRNIIRVVRKYRGGFKSILTDDELRSRLLFFCVYVVLALVSAGMTVLNVFSQWHYLTLSTFIFSLLNVINAVLTIISERLERASRRLFAVEMILLFTFFLVVGEPEGFSAIWMLMLPCFGLLLFRLDYGIVLSLFSFAILITLFWTDFGRSLLLYQGYTESFMLRFPMLYISFFAMGILFEYIRDTTQRMLSEARAQYQFFSEHDPLTKLFNREGFGNRVKLNISKENGNGYGLAILDIDDFKRINDSYGHNNGDTVLKELALCVSKEVGDDGILCRWGGEEFIIFFMNKFSAENSCEKILKAVRDLRFVFDGFEGEEERITVSLGLVKFDAISYDEFTKRVSDADYNLYTAKTSGKNKVVTSEI